jgi:2-polyprenyl-3-methyl-5-hydroxy-6-metoxy-1,4-benzoquinol methylase
MDQKRQHEIEHGKYLAAGGAESLWGWGSPAGEQRALRRARLVTEAAKLAPGKKALEIGCGTGMFTQIFAKSGAEITANDISPELLAFAKKQNPNVNFIEGPFEEIGQSGAYDAVIGSSVLHHLDIPKALATSYRLLKSGGRIAFAEPNMLNPQVFAERTFLRKALKYVSPDETAFVRWDLAKQLRQAGFDDIRIVPFDWLHPAIPKSLISVVQALGSVAEALPLVREFAGSLVISARKP